MYFQYICDDMTQLNSRVIRVFRTRYALDETPDLSKVVEDEVYFYAHTIVRLGLYLGLWEKVGKASLPDSIDVLFRSTEDDRLSCPSGISERWYVWRVNDEDFHYVGKLEGKFRDSEVGLVMAPINIIHRMRTGKYDYKELRYE